MLDRAAAHGEQGDSVPVTGPLPAGQLDELPIGDGTAPLYVLPFDKAGAPQAPVTAERVRAAVAAGITDVLLLSHGWNTDWQRAVGFYRRFVAAFDRTVRAHGSPRTPLRPLVVGVSWPSIALPESTAPMMAGAPGGSLEPDAAAGELAAELVAPRDRPEFAALVGSEALGPAAARRLAQLLGPLYGHVDDELPAPDPGAPAEPVSDVDDTLATWAAVQERLAEVDGPLVVSGPSGARRSPARASRAPTAASMSGAALVGALSPRNIVRMATLLLMKDRAGVVGRDGVGPQLGAILDAAPGVRVHLVGHSFGCKVLLAAACSPGLPRPVRSALLLQPALSYLALADDVPELGVPGGYSAAKHRCELPIMVTWSRRDVALHDIFPLAVRRRSDLGERGVAAAGAESPPTPFAAMGGWGPHRAPDVEDVPIRQPADGPYRIDGGHRVLALDGNRTISGHGDVVGASTAWALHTLMAQD
jgi:hypothetical protein